MAKPERVPVVLTVAGSDNSGGAGLQADLKTFTTLGCYGTVAVTCVVAEHPGRVEAIAPMRPEMVARQIRLVREAYPVGAAKTGMLHSGRVMREVAAVWQEWGRGRPPLVVDPVMVATSGALLLRSDGLKAMREKIIPLAAVVTPNLDEAEVLLGRKIRDADGVREAAAALARHYGVPFLVKGGHLRQRACLDVLHDGRVGREFEAPLVRGVKTHGTGCTFSAAIAAGLARGLKLGEAVAAAKGFITRAIAGSLRWERYQALNHLPKAHGAG